MGHNKSVSLIPVLFSFLFSITFTGSALASAAEDIQDSMYDKAMRERNGIKISNVSSKDGRVTYTATQEIIIGGSKHKLEQKDLKLPPVNDSFYKDTAKYAKGLFKANAVAYAASAAMEHLLNGVGYVMGEGGQVQLKPDPDEVIPQHSSRLYIVSDDVNTTYQATYQAACTQWATLKNIKYSGRNIVITSMTSARCNYNWSGGNGANISITSKANPDYNPSYQPEPKVPTDNQIEDAFSNWFKNNPGSVIDPVVTYIYSPKSPDGYPTKSTDPNNPSFGGRDITDDMMENYINNRNQALADDAYWRDKVSSPKSETTQKADSTKTETKTNADGSKIETKTETITKPNGDIETIVTQTPISPDGIRGDPVVSVETQTKPNAQVTDLPLVCDYFAFLCEWKDWTINKWDEFTEIRDDETEVEIEIPEVSEDYNLSVSGSCPSSFVLIDTTVLGMPYKIEFEWGDFCNILSSYVRPILIALASFYAILIVAGVRNNA